MPHFRMKVISGIAVAVRELPEQPPKAPAPVPVPVPVQATTPASAPASAEPVVAQSHTQVQAQESVALHEFRKWVYSKNAHFVEKLARKIKDPAELVLAHDLETGHPKWKAGRSKVLDAIEECLGEMGVSAPRRPSSDE